MDSGRLDVFFGGYLHHNDKFSNMWKVCKVILTLSHGQADVERGFSINKEMLVDNMRQTSLINQRLIFDHLSVENTELADFTISKDLLNSCKCASGKYKRSLEENKKEKVQSEGASKRKLIQEEIMQVKKSREDLQNCIRSLDVDINKFSLQAEEEGDMSLLVKANSFRQTKEIKLVNVETLETAVAKLEYDLRNVDK